MYMPTKYIKYINFMPALEENANHILNKQPFLERQGACRYLIDNLGYKVL